MHSGCRSMALTKTCRVERMVLMVACRVVPKSMEI